MSLAEAVKEIAEEMIQFGKENEIGVEECDALMISYGKQLLRALKAAEGNQSSVAQQIIPPFIQHHQEIEKAKAEFRKGGGVNKKASDIEEDAMGEIAELVGNPSIKDDTPIHMQIPANLVVGSKTVFEGAIYQYKEDGRLHYVSELNGNLERSRIILPS
jgi:hypothetical protein